MKAIVCGGRDFNDSDAVYRALDLLHARKEITEVIQGGAAGADTWAAAWAFERKVRCRCFPADWKSYGCAAGGIRNQQMLREGKPDLVVAFPGGADTSDMVKRAKTAGVAVAQIEQII